MRRRPQQQQLSMQSWPTRRAALRSYQPSVRPWSLTGQLRRSCCMLGIRTLGLAPLSLYSNVRPNQPLCLCMVL